ncbi:MAG: SEC-C domain-containing protein [Firmicutes bacterium]|nr:SEC-C domain-containing protein [Bacillota bacterium]
MSLYDQWIESATDKYGRSNEKVWKEYLDKEQKIYEYILESKVTRIDGSIEGLAQRFELPIEQAVAFVDGINGILDEEYDIHSLTAESTVDIPIDFERLYKKMVEYKADHLYSLPQWDNIYDKETRERLYKEQKRSTTYVSEAPKIGRNDPCPCGSGKKYKKCCGANK